VQESNQRSRLLRARGERPRGRTADERDEFTPSHALSPRTSPVLHATISDVNCAVYRRMQCNDPEPRMSLAGRNAANVGCSPDSGGAVYGCLLVGECHKQP
jgi:hypothetical protein